jgi:hypothetical protein
LASAHESIFTKLFSLKTTASLFPLEYKETFSDEELPYWIYQNLITQDELACGKVGEARMPGEFIRPLPTPTFIK